MKSIYAIVLATLCARITPYAFADHTCFPSIDCDASISGDCDELSDDYRTCGVATYFSPRSITNDLTYRNSNTFFNDFGAMQVVLSLLLIQPFSINKIGRLGCLVVPILEKIRLPLQNSVHPLIRST